MPLPAPLSRNDPKVSKNDFGHVLIIAGSPSMLGASCLASLAAMRSGAGLVTAAVPRSLNLTLQKKISHAVMTLALDDTPSGGFSLKGFDRLKRIWDGFDAVAIGPGMGREKNTLKFACQVIRHCPKPLVIDADALFALAGRTSILLHTNVIPVLTPHAGEMSRLTGRSVGLIEKQRRQTALEFAAQYHCALLLKGHETVVAFGREAYINKTGNAGMAKAGSGDVLTGMIAAFLAQGFGPFEAACYGAYFHGKAGDDAARSKSKAGMIATDIIESIATVLKKEKS